MMRRFVTWVCLVLLSTGSGCSTVVDPIRTGGEALPGTEDIRPPGWEENFSISPDGLWLVYPSEHGTPFTPVYGFYDLTRHTRHEIGLSERARELAAEGHGPLMRAGCWDPDGRRVVLPGDGVLFVATVGSNPLEWMVETADQEARRFYYDCPNRAGEADSHVRFLQRSARAIDVVDARDSTRVLARHRLGLLIVERMAVSYPTLAPDGSKVAYVVRNFFGFGGLSYGYVLDLASGLHAKPRLLAAPVYGPIHWSPDSHVAYACVGYGRQGTSVYRWTIK
jgi:hypothetical protein